jgi:hypothetical protein
LINTYARTAFTDEDLQARTTPVSICVLADKCPDTVGNVVTPQIAALQRGIVDQVLVVTADVATAAAARGADAADVEVQLLLPDVTQRRGPGAVIWGVLPRLHGGVVVFADGSMEPQGTDPLFEGIRHLACPILSGEAQLVKGSFTEADVRDATDLVLGVLLRTYVPELADLRQPATGPFAISSEVLERMPIYPGYAATSGILMRTWKEYGTAAIAQLDLGRRPRSLQTPDDAESCVEQVLVAFMNEVRRDLPSTATIPLLPPRQPDQR